MILIKDTKKEEVILRLQNEISYVDNLIDTINLFNKIDPAQQAAMQEFISHNAITKAIDQGLKKAISPKITPVEAISGGLYTLKSWLPKVLNRLKQSKTKTFDTETVTFQERGILDTISAVNFFNRYATMFLDVLLEQAHKPVDLKKMFNKIDFSFFNDTYQHFVTVTVRFSHSVKDLEEMLENLSEELADNLSEGILREADGEAAVSVRKQMAPHDLNPIYWYRLWRMRRDVKFIEVSTVRIETLAMKIARLNNQRNGENDPSLDRMIEVYEDKIIKLESDIRDTMEKYQ